MNLGYSLKKRLTHLTDAAKHLRTSDISSRDQVLIKISETLNHERAVLIRANQKDLRALKKTSTPAFRDRLTVTAARIDQMIESLIQVAQLADPLGEIVEMRTLQNGLLLKRVRSPLGVVFVIFESRPNVALEAFSLAFKSGNAPILRGGKESKHTTAVLYAMITRALVNTGFNKNLLWGITDSDRSLLQTLLQQKQYIDVVIPRGGEGLIAFVQKHSLIPLIKNDRGLCHVYVHEDADLTMAIEVIHNAKTQRPGVCNAMETLLVHQSVAEKLLPLLYEKLSASASTPVQWHGCPRTLAILKKRPFVFKATTKTFDIEYLDLKMSCRIVRSTDEAIEHIDKHGSCHSEAIVTKSAATAKMFQEQVDAAAVYWNASTRFTDGFEFGLGGEIGISTQKLHVRGPVGLRELTSVRWWIDGKGQVRK